MSDCSYAAMSNHKLTVANLCVKSNSLWTNFADNGKIHTCMYNVCTMYTTAVGVISPRQLARLFAPKWIRYLVQRLLDTGSWKCSARCARTAHAIKLGQWLTDVIANVGSWTCYRRVVRGKLLAGKCLWGNMFGEVFCSLRSHGTRDKAGSIIDRCYRERWFDNCSVRFAHTAHASLMGAYAPKRSANRALSREGRGVLSGDDKLTTANLCDRKKNADVGAMMLWLINEFA